MEIRDTTYLVDAFKKGIEKDHTQYCWFLGAGCSISSGIHSGWHVLDIAKKNSYNHQQKRLFSDWQQQRQISHSQYDLQFQQQYFSDEEGRNMFQSFLKITNSKMNKKNDPLLIHKSVCYRYTDNCMAAKALF